MSCVFPVCLSSPPECIFQAFLQSGYYYQLNPQQREAARSNPVGWLQAHPYLYSAYPSYFSQTCPSTTPSPGSPQWGQILSSIGCAPVYGPLCLVESGIQTYTGYTPPPPPPNNPSSGGSYDWEKPFADFGGFLLKVGAGINEFIRTIGSTYAEMVTATGRYPWGAIILFVFILVAAVAIGWIL